MRDHVKQNPSEVSANKLFLCYVAGSEHATKLKYGLFHKVQGSRVKNYNWSSLEWLTNWKGRQHGKKLKANNRAYEDRIESLNQKLKSFKEEIETLKQSKNRGQLKIPPWVSVS